MALQSSGEISFLQMQSEFGGGNPIGFNEYYRGGSYVPTSVGAPAGSWSSYQASYEPFVSYGFSFVFSSYNLTYINWGPLVGSFQGNLTTAVVDGFEYERGSQFRYQGPSKGTNESLTYYMVRRRTAATSVTVNTGIPASGTISMNQLYGGRNT